ncbi:hypothetical protein FHX57_000948 [Paraburkholderia tropica]|nr:hypothetical protein [Paraburkholderia tropica]MBB2998620.1 hypothetical protein [Paraburkholderia tropica]MBB6318605.1 hypothetical protein [Paraburkholderia tropica]
MQTLKSKTGGLSKPARLGANMHGIAQYRA